MEDGYSLFWSSINEEQSGKFVFLGFIIIASSKLKIGVGLVIETNYCEFAIIESNNNLRVNVRANYQNGNPAKMFIIKIIYSISEHYI